MTLVQYNSEQFEGLSRLINKPKVYVLNHAKALSEEGNSVDRLEAEIQTQQGLRTGNLFGEDFIYSLLAKAGIRVYFYGKAAQKALPAWKQARLKKRHPAGLVHDLITLRMSGMTRKQATNLTPMS